MVHQSHMYILWDALITCHTIWFKESILEHDSTVSGRYRCCNDLGSDGVQWIMRWVWLQLRKHQQQRETYWRVMNHMNKSIPNLTNTWWGWWFREAGRQSKETIHVLSNCTGTYVNTLKPRQNGRHFPDDIFKWIFMNENAWIAINISLKFVPMGPINNIPALVQVMAWRRPGDKPLCEPMMVRLPTHICVTRPQWVNKCHKKNSVFKWRTNMVPPI